MSKNEYTERPIRLNEDVYEGCPMDIEIGERETEKPGKNSKALKGTRLRCESGPEMTISANNNTVIRNDAGEISRSTEIVSKTKRDANFRG